jgi:hypothetical protein
MNTLLNKFGYDLVKYEGGKGLLIVDYGLTSLHIKWRSGSRIIKTGKVLVVNDCGEVFAKNPESQDHRKYIKIPTIKN